MSFSIYRYCSECGHGMWFTNEHRCEPCDNIVAARVHQRELQHAAAVRERIRHKLEMEEKVEREHPIPQEISDEQADRLKEQWEARHKGREHAQYIPIHEAKPVDHSRERFNFTTKQWERDEDDQRRRREQDDNLMANVVTAMAVTSMLDSHCSHSSPPSDSSPFEGGSSGGGGASESFDSGDSSGSGGGGGGAD